MIMRIENELRKRFEASNFGEISITMKCNNDIIYIRPCSYCPTITSFDQIDWYLMDSSRVNFTGGDTLTYVAKCIAEYEDRLREDADIITDIKNHIKKYGMDLDWDYVSDLHQDIFGHRPHVNPERLIAWANSDSLESARHFR